MSLSAKRGHPRTAFNLIRLSFRRLIWVGLWCLVYGLSFIAPTPAQQLKITFIVTDVDNKPVPNAQIKIARSGKSVSTNCDGTPIVAVSQPGRSGGTPNATPTPTLPDLPATGESYTTNAQGVFVMPNEKDFPANQAPYKITVTDANSNISSSELSGKLLQSLIVCDKNKKTAFSTQSIYFPIQLKGADNKPTDDRFSPLATPASSPIPLDKQLEEIASNQTYMTYGLVGLGLLSFAGLVITLRKRRGGSNQKFYPGGGVGDNPNEQSIGRYVEETNQALSKLSTKIDTKFGSLETTLQNLSTDIQTLTRSVMNIANQVSMLKRGNQFPPKGFSQPKSPLPAIPEHLPELAETHFGDLEPDTSSQDYATVYDTAYFRALDAYRAAEKGENVAPNRYLDPASSNAGYGKTELVELSKNKNLSSFWLFLSNEQEGWVIPNVRNISPNIASVFPSLSSGQLPPEIRPARATLDIHRMVWQVESQR